RRGRGRGGRAAGARAGAAGGHAVPRSRAARRGRGGRSAVVPGPQLTSAQTSAARCAELPSFEGSGARRSTLSGDAAGAVTAKVRPVVSGEEDGVAASVARKTLLVLTGVVIIAALATTPTAQAGPLTTSPASSCDSDAGQAFAAWGDSSYYARLFNGSFEGGSAGWYLSGGARVVSGNEPFFVGDVDDNHSLLLPSGSSAYSGTVC